MIYSSFLFSQKILILDQFTNSPIENVNLNYKKKGVVTNKNGIVDISAFNNNDVVEVSHLSYITQNIYKKKFPDTLFLHPKTNMLPTISLSGIVKVPISKKYPIFKIQNNTVNRLTTSTGALISDASSITLQEGQSGGGSPNYRGMEANRLLLILDGISLNNAIYRSGHVQSSATINPFFIESVSLLSGPASVSFGDGAMGGALIFKSRSPKHKNEALLHQQVESSNSSVVTSFKVNYHKKKFSHISAFSIKSAGNLKMGSNRLHGYENWGKEMTVENKQLYTNYSKADFMHKTNYLFNKYNYLQVGTQFSTSSNIYRYDKMNDIKNGSPKYAHWYYGPQVRFFQNVNYTSNNKNIFFDKGMAVISFQDIKESRHTQKNGEPLLNNRNENVKIYDFNLHFNKKTKITNLTYGLGGRKQTVVSTASLSNNNLYFYNNTRYPDGGSGIDDFFIFSQANFQINKKTDFLVGGRWNQSSIYAKFNRPNFEDLNNSNESFIKSALLSVNPFKNTNINFAYYSGFRNPNIDDVGKVFSKDDVNVVVPNKNLEPEYTNNLEVSFNYTVNNFRLRLQLFNTIILNAISREYGTVEGLDSIIYDGQMMRVQMNKNIERANIKGVSLSGDFFLSKTFLIQGDFNFLNGEKEGDMPLSHIPPFNSKITFKYETKQHLLNFYTQHNGMKPADKYDDAGVDNLIEATVDGNPSWYTLNLIYVYKYSTDFQLSFGVKNILDAHYKTFGSGLSASGRNFLVAIHSLFND